MPQHNYKGTGLVFKPDGNFLFPVVIKDESSRLEKTCENGFHSYGSWHVGIGVSYRFCSKCKCYDLKT